MESQGKDTPIELQVHIGLGAGTVVGMHVGGGNDRCEYVIGGEPLQQITGAEHLAKAGEIVVSPQAWKLIHNDVRLSNFNAVLIKHTAHVSCIWFIFLQVDD